MTTEAEGVDAATATVFLVSGGTGHTCEALFTAAMAQFPSQSVHVQRYYKLRDTDAVARVVRMAARHRAVILHTLVDPQTRRVLDQTSLELQVQAVDLLGPTISALADHFGSPPIGRPGLLYELAREQFERIEAVDYTLAHDDGQRIDELSQADVVLVGVSRVSKSVTCFYLAMRGLRAGNVPLTPPIRIPEELDRLPPDRVIGLTMQPARLVAIRRQRLERIHGDQHTDYVDLRAVARELHEAERQFALRNWTCIDVSYKATEEVAAEIVTRLRPPPEAR
ncbi:MAG: putative pyruvate, phosphate dikinase regulatory protein [Pirellulaceae bacterium]|nr:MAG: putative pyruvate, phosphate dikinase regulatory protein [Pirellulaceae bacterium]